MPIVTRTPAYYEGDVARGTGSFSIPKPSGTASKDFLVAYITWQYGLDSTAIGMAGWNVLFRSVNTGGQPFAPNVAIFWKIAGTAEPATYVVTKPTSGGNALTNFACTILANPGADSIDPFAGTPIAPVASGNGAGTSPSVTPDAQPCRVFWFMAAQNYRTDENSSVTWGANCTEVADVADVENLMSVAIQDRTNLDATGTRSWSINNWVGNTPSVVFSFALKTAATAVTRALAGNAATSVKASGALTRLGGLRTRPTSSVTTTAPIHTVRQIRARPSFAVFADGTVESIQRLVPGPALAAVAIRRARLTKGEKPLAVDAEIHVAMTGELVAVRVALAPDMSIELDVDGVLVPQQLYGRAPIRWTTVGGFIEPLDSTADVVSRATGNPYVVHAIRAIVDVSVNVIASITIGHNLEVAPVSVTVRGQLTAISRLSPPKLAISPNLTSRFKRVHQLSTIVSRGKKPVNPEDINPNDGLLTATYDEPFEPELDEPASIPPVTFTRQFTELR